MIDERIAEAERHTRGPWACHFADDAVQCDCLTVFGDVNGEGAIIASIHHAGDGTDTWGPDDDLMPAVAEAKANARLIAAAPKMLAMLIKMTENLENEWGETAYSREAREVIAAAKGRANE